MTIRRQVDYEVDVACVTWFPPNGRHKHDHQADAEGERRRHDDTIRLATVSQPGPNTRTRPDKRTFCCGREANLGLVEETGRNLEQMPGFQKRNLDQPDELTTFELGESRTVQLSELSFGRTILEPGWHWAEHIGPRVGRKSCQFPHFMLVASGRMRVVMDNGTTHDIGPGDVVDIPPGHDGWVVGDEPLIAYDIAGPRGWAKPPEVGERVLTTLLFTDIVGSTPLAQRLGDARWKQLLASFYQVTRLQLDRYRGHTIDTTGDGVLASFDGPARAIECAQALVVAAGGLDLEIRAGIHTGEVEVTADKIRGLTVHIAARVIAQAGPGEILVSSTSRQLASGSGLAFDDRGEHSLKGVLEPWRLFAVVSAGGP